MVVFLKCSARLPGEKTLAVKEEGKPTRRKGEDAGKVWKNA